MNKIIIKYYHVSLVIKRFGNKFLIYQIYTELQVGSDQADYRTEEILIRNESKKILKYYLARIKV